ncbi:MAG: transcription termination factor NusA [Elusimicrobia bacterium]|nr:transcription termination factor NusA [Elusimicrobiota bacterium]MDE2237225.1 transcription termination factor NusA [Elusimicrobiota bacterium]MDE2425473.1 transcription termination factor NusA [Elusimicrobiota bacterium]
MAKSELILALEQIEREKGVKKDDILQMIEGAVVSSLRKHVGEETRIEASIDPETAEFHANVVKLVVETVANPELEISLEQARRYDKRAQVGQDVKLPAPAADFARIAAQTAKQVLTQKVREVERDKLYDEFKPKEGEVISGAVHRFMDRNIVVDLGKTEAILPLREQIRRERYSVGGRVRAVILRVDKAQRGPQVLLSRASPQFLRRLFELEVPEIGEKIVEIVEAVRDPGFRAKVVVRSHDPKVDPIGACVGIRGSRIRSIMNEISGERIDLIPYSEDLATSLGNSLAPAKVSRVNILDADSRRAEIIVPDEQLSLAIGKEGQNVRMACRLTNWSLEVKSKQQASEAASGALAALEGVGPKTIEVLLKAGLTDLEKLANCSVSDLTALQGVGEKTAAKIIAAAQQARSKPRG